MKRLLILIALLSSSYFSWAQQSTDVTEAQAIDIATQYAMDHKFRSTDWFQSFDATATFDGQEWQIFFAPLPVDNKTVMLGDLFLIRMTPDGEVTYPVK